MALDVTAAGEALEVAVLEVAVLDSAGERLEVAAGDVDVSVAGVATWLLGICKPKFPLKSKWLVTPHGVCDCVSHCVGVRTLLRIPQMK